MASPRLAGVAQVEAELEAERRAAAEEQQRAREAIERQAAELQKLEEERKAKAGGGGGSWLVWGAGLRGCWARAQAQVGAAGAVCSGPLDPFAWLCCAALRTLGLQEAEAAAKAEEEERRAAEARFEELQRKMREAEERCGAVRQGLRLEQRGLAAGWC